MEIGGDRALKTSWGWVVKSLITCRLRLQRCNGCVQITWQVLSLTPMSMCVLVLLLLLFKGIVCLEINVNIYSLSHCSVWFSSEKHNNFFPIFHIQYISSVLIPLWDEQIKVSYLQKMTFALYVDICTICWHLHYMLITFWMILEVSVFNLAYQSILDIYVYMFRYWKLNFLWIFSLLLYCCYLCHHLTLKIKVTI